MTPPTSTLVAGGLLYHGGAAGGGSGPGPPHLGMGNACGQGSCTGTVANAK